jgi:hypothetical protein
MELEMGNNWLLMSLVQLDFGNCTFSVELIVRAFVGVIEMIIELVGL